MSGPWPVADAGVADATRSTGERSLVVEPDVGTAAWIDCAGHLPWGLSGDQREDDARSLTWEWDAAADDRRPAVGRGSTSRPPRAAASLSVKLCDVFPDGTSALITRGTLDLRRGSGRTWSCSSTRAPTGPTPATGSGSRSPAPTGRTRSPRPAPVTLTVHGGTLTLPLWTDSGVAPPDFVPGADSSSEDGADVTLVDHQATCSGVPPPARTHVVSSYDVPARRHRARGLPRRGRRRPPHLRPVGRPPRRRTA